MNKIEQELKRLTDIALVKINKMNAIKSVVTVKITGTKYVGISLVKSGSLLQVKSTIGDYGFSREIEDNIYKTVIESYLLMRKITRSDVKNANRYKKSAERAYREYRYLSVCLAGKRQTTDKKDNKNG